MAVHETTAQMAERLMREVGEAKKAPVGLFREEEARMTFIRPYTNREHLRLIEAHLADQVKLRPLRRKGGA